MVTHRTRRRHRATAGHRGSSSGLLSLARRLALSAASLGLGGMLLGCGGQAGAAATNAGGGTPPVGSSAQPTATAPGTTEPASSDAASIDACSLVTTAEVQTATSDTVSRTEKANASCTWWLVDDGGWIKLVIYPDARPMFDAAAAQATPVAGLGDKAFSDGPMLVVLKGDTMLQLGSEIILSSADPDVFTRPLMEAALARL